MCLLCIEIQKQKMTPKELARAYMEFDIPFEHTSEISDIISDNYKMDEIINELLDLQNKE